MSRTPHTPHRLQILVGTHVIKPETSIYSWPAPFRPRFARQAGKQAVSVLLAIRLSILDATHPATHNANKGIQTQAQVRITF